MPSATLAASMPTNPVVVQRITAMLARADLIGTRSGAAGGAWLRRPPATIGLDQVLRAVGGYVNLGCPPAGAKGCPVGETIPDAVRGVIEAVSEATMERLSRVTVADLLAAAPAPKPQAETLTEV